MTGHHPLEIRTVFEEDAIRPKGLEPVGLSALSLTGTLREISTEYLFEGTLKATLEGACDRCLQATHVPITLAVTWLFEPGSEAHPLEALSEGTEDDEQVFNTLEDDSDVHGSRIRYFENEEIELAPHVWEEIVFALPSKFLCSEECKGLCPECGANLSESTCECAITQQTGHPGLAGLKELFPDLPSDAPEE